MDIIEQYTTDVGATYNIELKNLITSFSGSVGEMLVFDGNNISGVPDIVFSTAHTYQPVRNDYVYSTYAYNTSAGVYENPSTFSSTSYRYPNTKHLSDFEDYFDQQQFHKQTNDKFAETSFGIDRSSTPVFKLDAESETNIDGLTEFNKFATIDSSLIDIISDQDKYELQFIFFFTNKVIDTTRFELEVGFGGREISINDSLCKYLISKNIVSKSVLNTLIKNKNNDIYPDIIRLGFAPELSQCKIYIFSPV